MDQRERLTTALAGRYRIEREIGSGGMATIFLAEDLRHDRQVAVKVLRPEVGDAIGVDRFLREIRIAATLSHPNILPLFDSGDADGLLYYVTPYVAGESLAERIEAGGLPVEEAVAIVREAGDALSRAHEAGVVHRDIKPQNILFEFGHVRVADFGLARALDHVGSERLTQTGVSLGTPHYMSPEQVEGGSAADVRSDVYSLGCVAYELLTGEPPFTGPTTQAVVTAHLAKPVPSVRDLRPDVPPGADAVIRRALAKDPEDRFQTVAAMTEALAHAMTAEAQAAERRRAARRRWVGALAGIGITAALAVGAWWSWTARTAPDIQVLAVLPASNMTRDPAQDYFVDGVHEALVTELQRAGIDVIARQSVLQYRGTDKPIHQIASELGVDALIQPAVGREGDSVVVDVSILEANSELPLFTQSFTARVQGVLGLFRAVSKEIAVTIGAALSEEAEARLAERPTVDPRVLENALLGGFHQARLTPEDLDTALGHYQAALAIDSLYAPAHAGIAGVWWYRAQMNLVDFEEAMRQAQPHADRARALDPGSAAIFCAQSTSRFWHQWQFMQAMEEMERCLELDPNDAFSRAAYGHMLMIMGRTEEAIRETEQAVQLDPLNPLVVAFHGTVLAFVGSPEQGLQVLDSLLESTPGFGFGYTQLAYAYRRLGQTDEETRALQTEFAIEGDEEVVAAMDQGMAAGGSLEARRRAAELLAERFDHAYVAALDIASLYRDIGEVDKALDWLERALDQHDPNLPYMGVMGWEEYIDQPRFRAVAEEVGLPMAGSPVLPQGDTS